MNNYMIKSADIANYDNHIFTDNVQDYNFSLMFILHKKLDELKNQAIHKRPNTSVEWE